MSLSPIEKTSASTVRQAMGKSNWRTLVATSFLCCRCRKSLLCSVFCVVTLLYAGPVRVKSGVAQGSVLGPFCFCCSSTWSHKAVFSYICQILEANSSGPDFFRAAEAALPALYTLFSVVLSRDVMVTSHARWLRSDRASRAVTPHSDSLADASTPSRSQTMLPLTIPTICMSLVAGALAGKAEIFVREEGLYLDSPNVTVSAHSEIACSLRCTALGECGCQGFSYLTNGTCLLYQDVGLKEAEVLPPEGNITTDKPALFRRPASPSECPGLSPHSAPHNFSFHSEMSAR